VVVSGSFYLVDCASSIKVGKERFSPTTIKVWDFTVEHLLELLKEQCAQKNAVEENIIALFAIISFKLLIGLRRNSDKFSLLSFQGDREDVQSMMQYCRQKYYPAMLKDEQMDLEFEDLDSAKESYFMVPTILRDMADLSQAFVDVMKTIKACPIIPNVIRNVTN